MLYMKIERKLKKLNPHLKKKKKNQSDHHLKLSSLQKNLVKHLDSYELVL